MIKSQRLPAALTPLDAALRLLLDSVQPVDPFVVALADAIGCVAASAVVSKGPLPAHDVAMSDGWALRARDLIGASSYSPLQLPKAPQWLEAGDRMPDGCDCLLDADMAAQTRSAFQVVAEVAPGHGMRRASSDVDIGSRLVASGQRIGVIDIATLRAAGVDRLPVRLPRVRVVDVPSRDGATISSQLVGEFVKGTGASVSYARAGGRDAAAIAAAIGEEACDLLLVTGGTGLGLTDYTVHALSAVKANPAHGLAIQPGRTAAVGRLKNAPVIAIPGAADQAFAVFLMLVRPALDALSGRLARKALSRPLARKISSSIGVAELALLQNSDEIWMPLAVRDLPLEAIARADAWLAVPAESEGYAAGTSVAAFALREN
ncbi:MAG: molybdopterin-binding protein [Afipia sp.]|nr:molybdopterin-binding protein [Afipia sp.]